MSWWSRLTGRTGLTARDKDLYRALGASETWSGEAVSAQGALNLSAFWACTRVTSHTIASLSLEVFELQANGQRQRVQDHPLSMILHDSPNADQTPLEFWSGRVIGLCTTGNAFAEKVSNRIGGIIALNPMPAETWVERKSDGLWYSFDDRGKQVLLPEERVLHIRAFGDGDVGMSPVQYARQTLGIAIASERAAGQVFSKGLRAKGFFTFPGALTKEQRDQARENFADRYSGPNAPGVGILEAGVGFQPVNISPKDAELITSRRFNVEEICRWMNVPPILIGHAAEGQTMWGSGVEHIMGAWYTLSLRAQLKNIEQAVAKRVMTPAERLKYRVKFNFEDLLRGDSSKRAQFYKALLDCGVMTINEVRKLEGLGPVAGGDVPRMQSQNQPITQAAGLTENENVNP